MTVTIKTADFDKVLRRLTEQPMHVVVGVIGQEAAQPHRGGDDDPEFSAVPATLVEVATFNHYGTSRIPARPFLDIAVNEHERAILKRNERIVRQFVRGALTLTQALELMGQAFTDDVKNTISKGVLPENAESTIQQKRSSTPLINTGQLRGAITYSVRSGAP